MTKEALRDAVMEARRFIAKAERVKFYDANHGGGGKAREVVSCGKDSAAMKRASLDLSMALSALRSTPRF